MFKRFGALALIICAACTPIKQEIGATGGFVGFQANKALPAVTQRQHADRYVLASMVLAPLALETAQDSQEASASIARVNALYGSLAALYGTLTVCNLGVPDQCADADPILSGGPYAFESLSYDVQSDLYFLAKALVINLDLKATAEELASLDVTALLALGRRLKGLFPVARRGAATYRDAIVLYADTVRKACTPAEKVPCKALHDHFKNRYGAAKGALDERDISNLLIKTKAAVQRNWYLTGEQRKAAVFHIDKACERAFDYQSVGDETGLSKVNCGTANSGVATSEARQEFLRFQ